VHHTVTDWCHGGNTNVNEMSLACGPDNRMVGPNGWSTLMNEHHDTEWHPPPTLDTGQNRINHHHHPERFRTPDEHTWTPDVPATRTETAETAPTADEPTGATASNDPSPPRQTDESVSRTPHGAPTSDQNASRTPADETTADGPAAQQVMPPAGPDPPLAA
jgi:hypothetical protein